MSHRRKAHRRASVLVSATALVTLAACGSPSPAGANDDEPIRIGVPTSLTGAFGTYGRMIRAGLEAGLHCSTDGTNQVGGRPVEFVYADDGGDAAKALASATGMVGDGVDILAGTVSSGIAVKLAAFAEQQDVLLITGAPGIDELTGANSHTFRASRQARQEAAAMSTLLPQASGKTVVLAQDYSFGQKYVSTITDVFGARRAKVQPVLVPLNAREFTPYARQVTEADPDLLIVVYYGDSAPAMWQALAQQGVLNSTTVASVLVEKANWAIYGPAAEKITFVSHYYPGAPGGAMNTCLTKQVPNADLSTHDGFVAAQMIVHALSTADPDDVAGMAKALDGWSFDAPKGPMTIRAGDHALLQDMYVTSLRRKGGKLVATPHGVVPRVEIAP
ncbi:substrate-binding domain-containing protein [Streptomyces sp. NPDC047009]|uniref:substrate-binding domain-containing protein n=1 Tax=Streptomyces sp. NPDC047009 TaxID=3154496 RepID=UPI0033C91D86